MKKSMLAGLLLLFTVFQVWAQEFKPKDTWPFLYADFTDGVVCSQDGDQILSGKLNISVANQRLYYIKGETLMEADVTRVFSVKIGEQDIFVNVGAKMYRILAESSGGAAVSLTLVDTDRMNKSDIGYGVSSATASTQNVAALALDSNVGTNINQAIVSRDGGTEIPVMEKKYILFSGNRTVPALRREVMDIPGLDKDAAKDFFKKNKIKWNNPASLTLVADFLTSMFNEE